MPASITVTGMVLSAMPVGDYDKRLVILTKEIGKISHLPKAQEDRTAPCWHAASRFPSESFLYLQEIFIYGYFC